MGAKVWVYQETLVTVVPLTANVVSMGPVYDLDYDDYETLTEAQSMVKVAQDNLDRLQRRLVRKVTQSAPVA